MGSSASKRKGQKHIAKRGTVKYDGELHAKVSDYAEEKGVDIVDVVEESLAKTIKFDMLGETWGDIGIDPDARAALLKYAQSHGNMPQAIILSQWVMECINYDVRDQTWKNKLAKSRDEDEENIFKFLDGACDGLAYGKNKSETPVFSCVWFMEGGPPKVRLLGHILNVVKSKCVACRRTEEIKRGLAERDAKIEELETKIQMKAKTSRKVPVCNKGAILSQEGTAFRSCPKSSIPVSVATYCKVLSGGLPCALFAEIELAEGPL